MGAGAVEMILPWPKMPLPPEMPPEAGGDMEILWFLPSPPLQSSTRDPAAKTYRKTVGKGAWERQVPAIQSRTEKGKERS